MVTYEIKNSLFEKVIAAGNSGQIQPAEEKNALAFIEALGEREFHQSAVDTEYQFKISFSDESDNTALVIFNNSGISVSTIDASPDALPEDAVSCYGHLTIEDAVTCIDDFFDLVRLI